MKVNKEDIIVLYNMLVLNLEPREDEKMQVIKKLELIKKSIDLNGELEYVQKALSEIGKEK